MAKPNPLPSIDVLRGLFLCAPDAGVLHFRGTRSRRHRHGVRAGSVKPDGYVRVGFTINGKRRYAFAHRIIWAMCAGRVPLQNEIIDHINGDKADNRIVNLRLATPSQNTINVKAAPSGVQHSGAKYKKRPFRARIMQNGCRLHLGHFSTKEEARHAYQIARHSLFGEFAS